MAKNKKKVAVKQGSDGRRAHVREIEETPTIGKHKQFNSGWSKDQLDKKGLELLANMKKMRMPRSIINAAMIEHLANQIDDNKKIVNSDNEIIWDKDMYWHEKKRVVEKLIEGDSQNMSPSDIDHVIRWSLQDDSYSSNEILMSPFVKDELILDALTVGNQDSLRVIFQRETLPDGIWETFEEVYEEGMIEDRDARFALLKSKNVLTSETIDRLWDFPEMHNALVMAPACDPELYENFSDEVWSNYYEELKSFREELEEETNERKASNMQRNFENKHSVEMQSVLNSPHVSNETVAENMTHPDGWIRNLALNSSQAEVDDLLSIYDMMKAAPHYDVDEEFYMLMRSTKEPELILKDLTNSDEKPDSDSLLNGYSKPASLKNTFLTSEQGGEILEKAWRQGYRYEQALYHRATSDDIRMDYYNSVKENRTYHSDRVLVKALETGSSKELFGRVLEDYESGKTSYDSSSILVRYARQKCLEERWIDKQVPSFNADNWKYGTKSDISILPFEPYPGDNTYDVKVDGILKGYVTGSKDFWRIFNVNGEQQMPEGRTPLFDSDKDKLDQRKTAAYELLNPGY